MHQYETMYIIRPTLEEEAAKETVVRFNELIAANGGTVEKTEEWGKRKLAYPIDDLNEGYYVLLHFTASPELPKELERNFRISEDVLRYLVTRTDA